jgi:hypothetical protein
MSATMSITHNIPKFLLHIQYGHWLNITHRRDLNPHSFGHEAGTQPQDYSVYVKSRNNLNQNQQISGLNKIRILTRFCMPKPGTFTRTNGLLFAVFYIEKLRTITRLNR